MSTATKNELTIVRILNAPREKVWRACSEPEALKQWWGMPKDATMPTCKVDFRVGGTLLFEVERGNGFRIWFKCIYKEIVAGAKLVMEQHLSDANGNELDSIDRPASTITMRFESLGGKTKLTVVHAGAASEAFPIALFEGGWGESLDRLAASLAR
jgi:uncharacterized protein YndB with AHSA1/START domain